MTISRGRPIVCGEATSAEWQLRWIPTASEIDYLWKLDTSPRETGATFIFTDTRSLPPGCGNREKSGGPCVAVAVGHIPSGKAPVRESIISPSHLDLQMASGSVWLKWSNVGSDETM